MFQAFKELGNAVIFSLLLEKALGQQEVVDILQAAPFQNLYPKPYVKGNVKLELFLPKNGITCKIMHVHVCIRYSVCR